MLLRTRIQSSPWRNIWRSRSRVMPCTSLRKIHEMELWAHGMTHLFRLPVADTLWKMLDCLTLKSVSFLRMRSCRRKMSPKQGQCQRLLVVVLCWCFATSCPIIHYLTLSSREVIFAWFGIPDFCLQTISSDNRFLQFHSIHRPKPVILWSVSFFQRRWSWMYAGKLRNGNQWYSIWPPNSCIRIFNTMKWKNCRKTRAMLEP